MPDGSIFPAIYRLLRAAGPEFPVLERVLKQDKERQEQLARSSKLPLHAQLPENITDEIPVHNADDR